MAEPWFSDPNAFGAWYGAIVGGVGGILAGLLGAAAGTLAPQGKGRKWILGGMTLVIVLGVVQALAGIAALVSGQPYAIWYPMLLCGGIMSLVVGSVYPAVRKRYDEAEQRRVDARGFRTS